LVTAIGRAWVIQHYPEPDGDAKGHLGIASALLSHPLSVAVHWVWPPGYHYALAGLLALGFTAQGVRLVNCALAALLPLLVWGYAKRTVERRAEDASARMIPFLAGLLCAAMPVVNLLGTSAQPGTMFTILVLLTAWSIDSARFTSAGVLLAAAAMVRYEACGAIGLLVGLRLLGFFPSLVNRLPTAMARLSRLPFVVVGPSVATVAVWLLAHRVADGNWFGFLRELYRYARMQRETYHQGLLFFPLVQPYYLFGLTLPLFALGTRRAWRSGFVVPAGIYAFLLVSYTFKGALGSGRYYESLTPFVCISAAYGVSMIGALWRPVMPLAFAAALSDVVWLLLRNGRWTFHL
jgi:Dolichyl-phosphate-mannose-protein mannosyltransferase